MSAEATEDEQLSAICSGMGLDAAVAGKGGRKPLAHGRLGSRAQADNRAGSHAEFVALAATKGARCQASP